MKNRQIDKNKTKQVRIDSGLHQLLKIYASQSGMSIKELLEDCLSELLAMDKPDKYQKRSTRHKKRYTNGTQSVQIQEKT
jgi:hypothetical protein